MRIREAFIQSAVADAFVRAGAQVRTEFPMLGRIADIYCLTAAGKSVAIECKERNWSHAIWQARTYQAAADFVYVAVPQARATAELLVVARTTGIGVLTVDVDGRVEWVLESTPAPHLSRVLRDRNRLRLSDPAWSPS